MASPRAGQPAAREDLIDVPKLITAYYTVHPDPAEPGQRVSFGTSGHRGSALTASFNEDHILATTQAICEYRASEGIEGPLFLGADTHALSEPARVSAIEVLAANGVVVLLDARDGYTPTPAVSRAILAHNLPGGQDRADGIVVTPVAQPAAGRRFQVQPAGRRPGRHRNHQQNPGSGQCPAGRRARRGPADPVCEGYDRRHHGQLRLPRRLRLGARAGRQPRCDQVGRPAHRRRSAWRCKRRLLGRDRRSLRPRPDRRQHRRRPHVQVHDRWTGTARSGWTARHRPPWPA